MLSAISYSAMSNIVYNDIIINIGWNWMKIGFVSLLCVGTGPDCIIAWVAKPAHCESRQPCHSILLPKCRQIRRTRRNRATNKLCHVPVCSRAVTCAMRTCFTLNRSVVPIKCLAHAFTTTFLFCGNTLAKTVCHRSSLAFAKPAHSVHAHERTCSNSEQKIVCGTGTRESHIFIETDGSPEIEENEWINQD